MLIYILFNIYADVAELADALVLGTSVNDVEVRVLSSAPNKHYTNIFYFVGGFAIKIFI